MRAQRERGERERREREERERERESQARRQCVSQAMYGIFTYSLGNVKSIC
jgi:hypothetical protein